jgi:hypothetical protein
MEIQSLQSAGSLSDRESRCREHDKPFRYVWRFEQHLTTFRNIKDIHPLSNTGDRNRQISQLQRLAALRTSPNKQRLINRKNILNEPV